MNAKKVKEFIKQEKLVPILRTKSKEVILDIAQAVVNAGCKILELTTTTVGVIPEIEKIKAKFPSLVIGLGTVFTSQEAEDALNHGVDFIVSPTLNYDIVDVVKSRDKLVILSGFTPTEIFNAYKAGADIVKLFPASEMSPNFIREIRGPMPFIDIFPTGGLDLISAIQYLSYGAVAAGMGATVFKKDLIESKNYDEISALLSNANHRIKNMEI